MTKSKSAPVKQYEVDAIANEMDAAGQEPTTLSVRAKLGRGSNTTINKCLATWRAQKAKESEPQVSLVLPSLIAKSVSAYMDDEINKVKRHRDETVAKAEAASERLAARSDELEAQVAALTEEAVRLRQENAEVTGRWQQLREEIAAERGRVAEQIKAADFRANEAERMVATLNAKLAATQERLEELRAAGKKA